MADAEIVQVASDYGADLSIELRDASQQDIGAHIKDLRETFANEATLDMIDRNKVLTAIKKMLKVGEEPMKQAVWRDLHKHPMETYLCEISQVRLELQYAIDHFENFAKPQKVWSSLSNVPGKSAIQATPYGVVLVIGTWNYPIALTLIPMITALAAGNCVVVRIPNEDTTRCFNNVLMNLMDEHLDKRFVRYVYGGLDVTKSLLEEHRFDMILATGSPNLGKQVMRAAAENLTPVVLELGGKNPAIVDDSADLELAARRIAWGAFANVGQTCIRPDYVLIDEKIGDAFTALVVKYVLKFFGSDPQASPCYGRFPNSRMYQRVAKIVETDKEFIKHGGQTDADDLYVAPTVLCFNTDIKSFADSASMAQEIFGPVLPILYYPTGRFDIPYRFVSFREKPLAVYHFSSNDKNKKRVMSATSSGSIVYNDVMMQFTNNNIPFGGVGNSGMGSYRGRFGLEAFTYRRAVMYKTGTLDIGQRYPPYRKGAENILRLIMYPMSKNAWELSFVILGQLIFFLFAWVLMTFVIIPDSKK